MLFQELVSNQCMNPHVPCCQDTHDNWRRRGKDVNTPRCDDQGHISRVHNTWVRDTEAGRHEKRTPNDLRHSTCCKTSHRDRVSTHVSRRFRQDAAYCDAGTFFHTCKAADAHGSGHGNSPLGKALCACKAHNDPCRSCQSINIIGSPIHLSGF